MNLTPLFDQLGGRAAGLQRAHAVVGQADAHPVGAVGAVEDKDAFGHVDLGSRGRKAGCRINPGRRYANPRKWTARD